VHQVGVSLHDYMEMDGQHNIQFGPVQVGDPKRLQRYLHAGDSKNYRAIYKLEIPDITVYYIYRLEIPMVSYNLLTKLRQTRYLS
jgi:hypothetical protein